MNKANCWKGRAMRVAILTVLAVTGSFATASPVLPTDIGAELQRAEGLFREGKDALTAGREAEAQSAFDGALDVFVGLKQALGSDPRIQKAYLDMVERIHGAEVAAGSARSLLPATPSFQPLEPAEDEATPPTNPPENTLAELGEKIETLRPTEEARQTNAAVLGSEQVDLPIEMNDQVVGAINLYSGKFRNWFSRALSRGLPHLPRIREILAEAGIPQDLAYIPIVESAFNPVALSRAKAKGLWQFIPSTGKQYGLKQDFFVDERSNMEKATVAAARYLKNLYAMFGDWNLALAGYNAGEGRVQRAIKKAQTNDFWELAKTRSFRSETKNYVPLIHAAIVIAKSPDSYGIELAPVVAKPTETIRVAASYPITIVARCGSTAADAIRLLNPELRRGLTPASAFDLRVPHGAGDLITSCLATERSMSYTRHVVRKRETFSQLSKAFGVSSSEIARINGLDLKARLRPGTELAIPRSARKPAVVASTGRRAAAASSSSYRIRKGDTLSDVAARHSTTVAAIKALNRLNSNRLSIGQVLVVSGSSTASSSN